MQTQVMHEFMTFQGSRQSPIKKLVSFMRNHAKWILPLIGLSALVGLGWASWKLTSLPARSYAVEAREVTMHEWASPANQQSSPTATLDHLEAIARVKMPKPLDSNLSLCPADTCHISDNLLVIEPPRDGVFAELNPLRQDIGHGCALDIRATTADNTYAVNFRLLQDDKMRCDAKVQWRLDSDSREMPVAQGKYVTVIPRTATDSIGFFAKPFRPQSVSIVVVQPLDVVLDSSASCHALPDDRIDFSGGLIEISRMSLIKNSIEFKLAMRDDWSVTTGLCEGHGTWMHIKRASPYFWGAVTAIAAFVVTLNSLLGLIRHKSDSPSQVTHIHYRRWRR
jgi:hypothetical protein